MYSSGSDPQAIIDQEGNPTLAGKLAAACASRKFSGRSKTRILILRWLLLLYLLDPDRSNGPYLSCGSAVEALFFIGADRPASSGEKINATCRGWICSGFTDRRSIPSEVYPASWVPLTNKASIGAGLVKPLNNAIRMTRAGSNRHARILCCRRKLAVVVRAGMAGMLSVDRRIRDAGPAVRTPLMTRTDMMVNR